MELAMSMSPSKSVASHIKDGLRSHPTTKTSGSSLKVVKRSEVRLKERERQLAELREKFYDATTIDDSVLNFPHNAKMEAAPEPAESQILALSIPSGLDTPVYGNPSYFTTAVARSKKAASKKVEPRYNKKFDLSASQAEKKLPLEDLPPSPQGATVAPALVKEIQHVAAAEVLGMQEQISMLVNSVEHRMEDIFTTGNYMVEEGEEVEAGQALVKDLGLAMKEIPEAMVADNKDAAMDNAKPLADTTYPIAKKLTSGSDAIRSHHNLFSQFQFKCISVKDVLGKIIDRAENVAGPNLLDQYRKDCESTGFERSKAPKNKRVMGMSGKNRRLGSTIRNTYS